ncbi:MAG: enoyl-CoA hydratase/isomerase family protein [Chloroflexota bacterium]
MTAPEPFTTLLTGRDDAGVVRVELNRPEARNAISRVMASEIARLCLALAGDAGVRALVLSGAGGKAFCAGADLRERQHLTPSERTAHTVAIEAAAEAIAALPFPTIAAVHGFALAGGCELAVACDLRVAGRGAVFGLPEVKIGIFPGAGGVHRLPHLIGLGAARDLLFTGRQAPAAEAFRLGLVDRLVDDDLVMDAALDLAAQIATNAPLGVRAVKLALRQSQGMGIEDARLAVNALRAPLDATDDYQEGLAAFAEKRSPRFRGR